MHDLETMSVRSARSHRSPHCPRVVRRARQAPWPAAGSMKTLKSTSDQASARPRAIDPARLAPITPSISAYTSLARRTNARWTGDGNSMPVQLDNTAYERGLGVDVL